MEKGTLMKIKHVDTDQNVAVSGSAPLTVAPRYIRGVTGGANQRPKVWHPGEMDHASQIVKKENGERS